MIFFRFFQQHPLLCTLQSFFFYWSFAALLFIEVALAVNRWAAVCTHTVRYVVQHTVFTHSDRVCAGSAGWAVWWQGWGAGWLHWP